jgi:hypothetical protein
MSFTLANHLLLAAEDSGGGTSWLFVLPTVLTALLIGGVAGGAWLWARQSKEQKREHAAEGVYFTEQLTELEGGALRLMVFVVNEGDEAVTDVRLHPGDPVAGKGSAIGDSIDVAPHSSAEIWSHDYEPERALEVRGRARELELTFIDARGRSWHRAQGVVSPKTD